MNNKLIEYVKGIIEQNGNYIPKAYKIWEEQKEGALQSVNGMIQLLINLFAEEEKAIRMERKKSYVTDSYENEVRIFAIELIRGLMKYNHILVETSEYMSLLGQKHMSYAFYHLLNMNDIDPQYLLNNTEYMKCLYLGLMKFYTDFYGSFKDNEEAICLLCKYYPRGNDSWIKEEEFIDALFDHIKNAGTPSDFGYAYQGIDQIQKYIHGLSHKLILRLLKQYDLYGVLYQKIYRHQMYAIINGSDLEDAKKYTLKFFYMDSLLLANIFNNVWVDNEKEIGREREVYFNLFDKKLDEERIQVCKVPNAYWDNNNIGERRFYVEKEKIADIAMGIEKINFTVQENKVDFPFAYSDWELEEYQTKKVREKIRYLVSDDGNGKPEEKQMVFSLLYLDNYRGIENHILDFDHRFMFHPDSGEVKRQETERKIGFHFYGKRIYSLSCIVGKNGTGKTSIIDFLRDTFYKILRFLEDSDIICEKGCIKTENFYQKGILDAEIRFLVVFRIGEEDYFLTNIEDVNSVEVFPYQKGICRNLDFCKVVYFSQQFLTDKIMFLEHGEKTERKDVSGVSRTLEGLRQCDYSEMKSYVRRKNVLADLEARRIELSEEEKSVANRELCYQFSLLRNLDEQKLREFLDMSTKRKFAIYNLKSGEILEEFSLEDYKSCLRRKKFEKKYVKMPDAGIGFFSSGQYAKFTFLSKLYWFLEGYHKDLEYYKEIFGRQFFSREDALQQEESALIFIDEGELYYHPEWQRRYLSTLLDMLCLCGEKSKIQVVLTTNSPFIVSDVLQEDVQYLSKNAEEFGSTLGQNIHKLLKKNFFMDYTIGEYSRKMIETIVQWLGGNEDHEEDKSDLYQYFDDTQDVYEMIEFLIKQIGESVYRDKLEGMLEEMMKQKNTREYRIRELERKRADLDKEISLLKGEKYDKNRTL